MIEPGGNRYLLAPDPCCLTPVVFEEQADGGCLLGVVVFVGVDRAAQFTSELSAKGWLPDDSDVDPETRGVSVSYDEAEPE